MRDEKKSKEEHREHGRGNFIGDVREKRSRHHHSNSVYCPCAGKHKMLFDSEGSALRFIEFNSDNIEAEYGSAPRYVYYCDVCMGWHTSSKKLPSWYKSKTRRIIGAAMDRSKVGIRYCESMVRWLDNYISDIKSGVCDYDIDEIPLGNKDAAIYNGFAKRHGQVVAYFRDGMPEERKDNLIKSLRKYKTHVEKHMLERYRGVVKKV